MNRDNTPKNDKSKIKLTRGNQITTYQQDPRSWIEITEDELPDNIVQQDVVKVYEFTQSADRSHSNDVTFIEESIIQETDISSSSAQTEYIIDKHKYSKEAIKPYFLSYLDLEDKCSSDSTESIKNYLIGEDIYQKLCEEFNSGIKKVDTETRITPRQSSLTCIADYLKSLADKARKESNQIIFERSIIDPLFKSENNTINVYPLSCETLEPKTASISSRIKNFNIRSDLVNSGYSAESVKKIVLTQVDCEEDQMSELDETSDKASSCPPPVEVCHKCGSENCSEEVHIMCRKGDVHFKLKCKRLDGGHQKSEPQIGDEVKYECEVILDNGECIDSSILESRDLKCELINNSNCGIYPQNIKHDVSADINPPGPTFTPRCDIGPCPPSGGLSTPCPPCPPCPPNTNIPEKEDTKNEDTKFKIIIKAKRSDTSNKSKCPEDEEDKKIDKCPKEKLIFACRSKTKIKPQEIVEGKIDRDTCKQGSDYLEEVKTAMLEAHCRTIATIKEAAQDVFCNVDKVIGKSKKICDDPCILDDAKRSAENFVCELQKKANDSHLSGQIQESVENIHKSACNTIKKLQTRTRAAVDEATKQGKKWLGIKSSKCQVDEEDVCKPPPLPKMPKPKNTSYSCDDDDPDLSEAESNLFIKVIGLDTDERLNRTTPLQAENGKENPISKVKRSAENVINEVRDRTREIKGMSALERLEVVKNSAEHVLDKVVSTTQTIKDYTEEAVNEIATGTQNIYNKRENIKNVLSGFKLFNKEDEEIEEEKEKPVVKKETNKSHILQRDSSLFGYLRHSFHNLANLDDESSPYDRPMPKDVAILPETSSSKGVFTKIKEKFISMFYDRQSKDSLSSNGSSEENSETNKNEYVFDKFLN